MPAIKLIKPASIAGLSVLSYDMLRDGISQSLMGAYQTCRRSFLLSINRWEHATADRVTGYGSMMHDVLDVLYTGFTEKLLKYNDLSTAALYVIDDYNMPKVIKDEEVARLKNIAQAMIDQYILHYRRDFAEFRFEDVESQFEVEFNGFKLRGKKDGRFRDKNKGVWHIEHKNYSFIKEDNMLLYLGFDLQNLFYMLADEVEFQRLLNGVVYNVLRKPDVKKKTPTKDVYKYLSALIHADPKHYFIRYEIPYSRRDLSVFKEELTFKLNEIKALLTISKVDARMMLPCFYKNECACDGKWACEYLTACATGSLVGYRQKKNLYSELDRLPEQRKIERTESIKELAKRAGMIR